MALNPYLSHAVTTEQDLYADLIIESIKAFGEDLYYLPRDVINRDTILNDEVESLFDSSYVVEMYIENIEGFEGEGNLLAKFGLEIRDEATFIVAKRTWNSLVGGIEGRERPLEGDIIYMPFSKSFFEISFVEHEQPFYQLSNLPIYKLQARLFEYNDEEFNTGVEELDAIETRFAFTNTLPLSGIVGTFQVGETVTQPIGLTGETITADIIEIQGASLIVSNITASDNEYHEFTSGSTVTGDISGATGVIATAPTSLENEQKFNDAFIDFSENNPFGEV